MKEQPAKRKIASKPKEKHPAAVKTGARRRTDTTGGGGETAAAPPEPVLDSGREKISQRATTGDDYDYKPRLGGGLIEGYLALEAIKVLKSRLQRERVAKRKTATRSLEMDFENIANFVLGSVVGYANRGDEWAVRWLAARRNLAGFKGSGYKTIETIATEKPEAAKLWHETKARVGRSGQSAGRSPLNEWAHKLHEKSCFFANLLPRTPHSTHSFSWAKFQTDHIKRDAALPFPKGFTHHRDIAHFIDEIAMPFLKQIEQNLRELWKELTQTMGKEFKLKLGPNWPRFEKRLREILAAQ